MRPTVRYCLHAARTCCVFNSVFLMSCTLLLLLLLLTLQPFHLDAGNPTLSSPALPPSPLPYLSARVGPLELANALAACVLSARLSSKHRQWAAEQLVQALAATGRDGPSRPQTYSDLAGDLRKCSLKRLEGHYNKVSGGWVLFLLYHSLFAVLQFLLTTEREIVLCKRNQLLWTLNRGTNALSVKKRV